MRCHMRCRRSSPAAPLSTWQARGSDWAAQTLAASRAHSLPKCHPAPQPAHLHLKALHVDLHDLGGGGQGQHGSSAAAGGRALALPPSTPRHRLAARPLPPLVRQPAPPPRPHLDVLRHQPVEVHEADLPAHLGRGASRGGKSWWASGSPRWPHARPLRGPSAGAASLPGPAAHLVLRGTALGVGVGPAHRVAVPQVGLRRDDGAFGPPAGRGAAQGAGAPVPRGPASTRATGCARPTVGRRLPGGAVCLQVCGGRRQWPSPLTWCRGRCHTARRAPSARGSRTARRAAARCWRAWLGAGTGEGRESCEAACKGQPQRLAGAAAGAWQAVCVCGRRAACLPRDPLALAHLQTRRPGRPPPRR
jgi:hypothetical protein